MSTEGGEPRLLAEGYAAAPSWSPDGLSVLLRQGRTLFSVPREGGAPTALPTRLPHEGPNQAEYSPDRQAVYYSVISGQKEQQAIWKLSLKSGRATQLTNLEGRSGNLSYYFDITPKFIYFTWREDEGDIWVMDVVDAAPPTR